MSRSKEKVGAYRSKPQSLQAAVPLRPGTANDDDERQLPSESRHWNALTVEDQCSQGQLTASPPDTSALGSINPYQTVKAGERTRNLEMEPSLIKSVNENVALRPLDGQDRKKMRFEDGGVGEKAVSTGMLTGAPRLQEYGVGIS